MKTERLIQSGILNNGEPRHYASWDPPQVPKLNTAIQNSLGEALYRRQRAHAPKVRRGGAGWLQMWHSLKRS